MTNDHFIFYLSMHIHGSHFDSHKPFRDLGHEIKAFGEVFSRESLQGHHSIMYTDIKLLTQCKVI